MNLLGYRGTNRLRVPSSVRNVQGRILLKVSSNLRVLDERSLIGVINMLTDVCVCPWRWCTLSSVLRTCLSVHVPVEMDPQSSSRPVRRTRTTSFKIVVFWDVMPCSLVGRSVRLGRNLLPFVCDEDEAAHWWSLLAVLRVVTSLKT